MFAKRTIFAAPMLLWVLVSGCDDKIHTAPSPSPAPAPTPVTVTDVWNIAARMTAASGGECVGELMRSRLGVAKDYSLRVTRTDSSVNASLKSTAGDYACAFTGGTGDATGFTFGTTGYFSCEVGGHVRGFQCGNGMRRDMLALGQSLSGRIAGSEIRGTWHVDWVIMLPGEPDVDIADLETTTEYVGGR